MDRKLPVFLAVALFGVFFVVCADDEAADVKKAEPVAKEMKADKPAPAAKPAEVKKDETLTVCSILKTTLLYIPNRLFDVFDIVTVDLGAGAEFGVDVRLTRWMQFGGMYGDKYFLGKDYARQLGGGYSSGWNYGLVCLTSERRYVDDNFGTTREFLLKRKPLSLAMPGDDFTYAQDIRDFWEVGANAGWLVILGVAIHPVEMADLLAGLVLVDLKGDDYGLTLYSVKD
ncbi:MAG: hypothetical protein WCS96_01115 [Victivallales bacterium]